MKKLFTLIAAMLASAGMMAQDVEWGPNANPNVDCEGTDFRYYAVKPNKLADGSASTDIFTGETLTAEVGLADDDTQGKCVKVLSAAGAANDWDAQFWIVIPETVDVGGKIKVSFKYKADWDQSLADANGEPYQSITCGTQAHGTPGNYHHWACIGDVTFTTEWQTYEAEITVSGDMAGADGFHSVAFNLCQNNKDFDATFFFDDLEVFYEKQDETMVTYWKPVVTNGDFEGENMSNYVFRVQGLGDQNPTPVAGVGMDETKGLELVVPAKSSQTYDHQFFIKMNEPIPAGDLIKVSFDYRASEDMGTGIDTQSHGTNPGDYKHYTAVGTVTFKQDWQHYEFTQSVTTEQSPNGEYQVIAFNLAVSDHPVTLYLDNVKVTHKVLVPAGENPALIALTEYIGQLEGTYSMDNLTSSAYPCNNQVRTDFQEAYNAAIEIGEDDDAAAIHEALLAAEGKFQASCKDYAKLNSFIALIDEKKAQAGERWADLATALEELQSPLIDAYNTEEWTRSEINEAVDNQKVYDMVAQAVKADIKAGDDVTLLMNNSKYNWGSEAWAGSPSVRDGAAEKYHVAFDVNQTLKAMPKGAYTIRVNGFQRIDSNDNGEVGEPNAMLYANASQKALVIRDEAEDAPEGDAPNDMTSAGAAFAEGYYANEINALLNEDGDLTVGVKGGNGLLWAIWGNWTVTFKGMETSTLAAAITDQVTRVNVLAESLDGTLTDPILTKITEVCNEAEALAAKADLTEAEADKAVAALIALCEEIQKVSDTVKDVEQAYTDFMAAKSDFYDTTTDALKARADKAEAGFDEASESYYLTLETEELVAYAKELRYLAGAMKIPAGAYDATAESGFDLTSLFENPDFENYAEIGANANYNGWAGSGFGTGGGTAGAVAERWNQASGFNTYVDFTGLPEGLYEISCDGAYRTSINADWDIVYGEGTTDNEAFLYGKTSDWEEKVAIHNIAEGRMTQEEAEAVGIDVSANCSSKDVNEPTGEKDEEGNDITATVRYYFPDQLFTADQWIKAGKYLNNTIKVAVPADGKLRVGVTRKGAANDWAFLDNFKLTYFGQKAAVGVEGIEMSQTGVKGIFDLQGRKVSKAVKGIYIINGKKVVK